MSTLSRPSPRYAPRCRYTGARSSTDPSKGCLKAVRLLRRSASSPHHAGSTPRPPQHGGLRRSATRARVAPRPAGPYLDDAGPYFELPNATLPHVAGDAGTHAGMVYRDVGDGA